MQTEILNFKRFESGAMFGFCDLQVNGLTVRGCKLFYKDGGEKAWFSWPSDKRRGKDGKDVYTDIVQASEAFTRHLQAMVQPQIKALLNGAPSWPSSRESALPGSLSDGKNPAGGYPEEDLSTYRSSGEQDDIPF